MCLFGSKIIIASILLVIIYEFGVLASTGQGSGSGRGRGGRGRAGRGRRGGNEGSGNEGMASYKDKFYLNILNFSTFKIYF